MPRTGHKEKIKLCYLTCVQRPRYSPLLVIQHIFCPPTLPPNHSVVALPHENLYRLCTKTCRLAALSDSLSSSGRPFLCSPSFSIWLFCKESFCCLWGEVMFSWKCTGVCESAAPGYIKGKHTMSARTTSPWLVVKDRSRNHSRGDNYSCGMLSSEPQGICDMSWFRPQIKIKLLESLLLSLPGFDLKESRLWHSLETDFALAVDLYIVRHAAAL